MQVVIADNIENAIWVETSIFWLIVRHMLTLNFLETSFFFITANMKISALLIQFNINTWRTKILLFQFSVRFNYCHFFFIFV